MPEKSKILIIIHSMSQISKLISEVKKLKENRNNETVLVALNSYAQSKLDEENLNYKATENYELRQKLNDLDKKAISWIKKWPSIKIRKNENFKELVAYENISLWWLVDVWFYLASSFNYYPIKEIIKNIEIIRHIIDIEKPNHIIVIDSKSLIGKITILVGNQKKIPISVIESGTFFNFKYSAMKFVRPFLIKNFKNTKELFREISGKILKFSFRYKSRYAKTKNKILFVTHPTYIQSSIDIETKEKIKEDTILGPVIRELKKDKNNEMVLVDTDPFPIFRFGFLFEKKYKHIEGYLNNEIKKKISQEAKKNSIKWKQLKRDKSFLESLTYKNIPLFELVEDKFSELFYRKFIEAVKYIEMMLQVVKKEKPDVIVIVDEYGLYGRAAITVGKIKNIPTLAIQHGALTPNDLGWLHSPDEISSGNLINPEYCPIPDKTAVSGEYYKNILTQLGSYPEDRVIITGQPKYDILAHANNFFEKRKIYDRFNIEHKKKLAVLATQPLPENELLFRSVFREIKKLKNMQLVIKLHPNEYDESLHRNIAKEVGLDVILTKDINLFELLNACDVLMTVSSTVALEAMILDKPVIIVDLKTNPDETAFVKSGVAIGVYKPNDISKAIIKVSNDKETKRKLQNNMKNFVYEHAYRIDGLAYKRIVKLINGMINKPS